MQDLPGGPVLKNPPVHVGKQVWSLVWEDPTCHGAVKSAHHNYWSPHSRAHALQQEKHRDEDPRQPKIINKNRRLMQLFRKCLGENETSLWLGGRTKGRLWVWIPHWQEMFWMETLGQIAQVWKNILYYLMTERVKYKDPVYLWMSRLAEGERVKSGPTLCVPMDCSLPGSSVRGIFQARELRLKLKEL